MRHGGRTLTSKIRKKIDAFKRERQSVLDGIRREKVELQDAINQRDATAAALEIARGIAEVLQRDAHTRIAGLVTRCLSAVFGDEAYEFRIITEQKRNRTEARAVFVRDGEEFDALSSIGGGVVDVAAFALRVAVILAQDPVRRLLILDEPMKFVSAEYRPQVRALLETLADELDVQIVLVTHISDLELGKIVRITS
jgi:DNA repair exonuclease SbcCD ATPase subunit